MPEKDRFIVIKPHSDSEFISATPSGAARKTFRHSMKKMKKSQRRRSSVIRVARKGEDKVFSYKVTQVRSPQLVERNGELIHYEYTTKVKSLNMNRKKRSSR